MTDNPKYWKIAPGEQAKDWDVCIKEGIIPIYFNDYFQKNFTKEVLNYDKDKLWKYFKGNKTGATDASSALIWNFLHDLKIGDFILTNKGTKKVMGWGIVKSGPKIYKGDRTFTIVRDVEWQKTDLNRDLSKEQGKNFFKAILQITEEDFNSIVNPMLNSRTILLAKIGWSTIGWSGFDKLGSENKDKFGYKFIKEHGFGNEWWNFYDYGDNYYYGTIQMSDKSPSDFKNHGLILFSSINVIDQKFYVIGFYGDTEYGKFSPPIDFVDTIQDQTLKERVKEAIPDRSMQWRGKKEFSSKFYQPIEFEIKDINLTKFGQAPYIYVGEGKAISKRPIRKLLEKVIEIHKELLKTTNVEERVKVQETIEKTKKAISQYLPDSEEVLKSEIKNSDYQEILDLLEYKKQIILYGPPGTGKTYQANKFISTVGGENYEVSEKSHLDQRIYVITLFSSRDGVITDLKPGDQFTYEWIGRHNYQKYFDEIEIGDTALGYFQNKHQITTILRCTNKTSDKIFFEIVRHFKGPTFNEMKKEKMEISSASWAFSLKSLKEGELDKIIQMSDGLSYESMGIINDKTQGIVKNKEFVTFHPSFGYEDFIEGLRPITTEDGTINYQITEGIFKEFSRDALNVLLTKAGIDKEWFDEEDVPQLTPEEKNKLTNSASKFPFYLIIDEINRGDISRIFGELITLIEADKRYGAENELFSKLPYSKKRFAIPPNLYIIGTMNTADKSIALIDLALRRRFGFIECMPEYDVLEKILEDKEPDIKKIGEIAVHLLRTINEKIIANYDRDHQIGHSYFTKIKDANTIEEAVQLLHFAWYHEIIPILQEYYYDSPGKLYDLLGSDFVKMTNNDRSFLFSDSLHDDEFIVALQKLSNSNQKSDIEP